jgi:hypothetical protein
LPEKWGYPSALTVVEEILEESGVLALVQSAPAGIPGDTQYMLAFF